MKRYIAPLVFLIAMFAFAEISQAPNKYKVTVKIVYNEMTLQDVADLEKQIKKDHKNACEVEVSVEAIGNWGLGHIDTTTFPVFTPRGTLNRPQRVSPTLDSVFTGKNHLKLNQ